MADDYAASRATSSLTTPRLTASADTERPDVPCPAYDVMRNARARCRALWRGNDAIRDGGTAYVPKFAIETDDAYDVRKSLASLHPGFTRTVKACVGLLLQQEPTLGDDMAARLVELWEDIDRAGTHGVVFTSRLLTEGLLDGLGGILVEYPRVDNPDSVSADDEKRLKLRPYWIRVAADDLYCPLYQTIDGVRTLVLLIVREVTDERKGRFGVQPVERFRIYARVGASITCEVWEKKDGAAQARATGAPIPLRNVSGIPFAPFVPGEPVGGNLLEVKPTLLDLADLNLEHHQVKTGIRYLEETACIPQQVRIGAAPLTEDDPAVVAGNASAGDYPPILRGPGSTIEAPRLEGVQKPVYWDSPDVTVLEPAAKSLDKIETAMGAAGLAFLAPETRAAETAEAKRIDAAAQNATIRTVGRALQDCLETAFGFTAEYLKLEAGSVTVNTEFEETALDAAMLAAFGNLARDGNLSRETLWDVLEQRGVLPEGFDKAAETRRILAEGALPSETTPTGDPLPDSTPPGGKRPNKATITDMQTGKTHTIVTE